MFKAIRFSKVFFILFMSIVLFACSENATTSNEKFQAFNDVYEPSGVLQLNDGRILIVEDEKDHPFSLLQQTKTGFKRVNLKGSLRTSTGKKAPALNDLEAVTQDQAGWIYAITSHSRNSSAQRKNEREQLVRFQIKNNRISDYQIAISSRLMEAFVGVLPKKKQRRKLNIEGLAYDPKHKHLLIGLRAPLLDDHAVIIRLKNPHTLFNTQQDTSLKFEKISLNLKGKSIRSIEYDPILKGYLIVAGSVKDRRKAFKLWLWKADKLHQVDLSKLGSIGYTEGIAPIKDHTGEPALLLVQDDGERGKAAGHYLLISYEQLKIK